MTTATETETYSVPRINDTAPDFTADTTQGTIHFHDWIGDGWAILFSHPKDFTPVCTTELGYMAKLQPEFAKRNTKIIGLSVDPVTNHSKWAADIEETQGAKVNYPMIGDPQLKIAKLYGMLPASAGETSEGRTPADNATVRTVFVIGPDKKVKLQISYPMTHGPQFRRNPSRHRFHAAHGKTQSRDPGKLEARRRCDHHRRGFQRRSCAEVSRLQDHQAVSAGYGAAKVEKRSCPQQNRTRMPRINPDSSSSVTFS